jgi:Lon protease-like protein
LSNFSTHGVETMSRASDNGDTLRIPLFPLNVVLLPKMPLPLHIFEERYKLMIGKCLEEERPFGIVYQGSSGIRPVGCEAHIQRVISRYDDGRLDILTLGNNRFRVSEFLEEQSYMEGLVAPVRDNRCAGERSRLLAEEAISLLTNLAEMTGHSIEKEVIARLEPEEISFLVASSGIFTLREKQGFLELTSTEERLAGTIERLREAIARREMVQGIKKVLGVAGDISHMLN